MRWLYCYFPQLQLDSLYQQEELPLAIVCEKSNQLKQLNQVAMNSGLSTGTGLGSAAAMCHQLQVFPYKPEVELKRLQQLASLLYQYASDIALDEVNGLFINIANMKQLYPDVQSYWQLLESQLVVEQLQFQFALADTPMAAKLLAYQSLNELSFNEAATRDALSLIKTDALFVNNKIRQSLIRLGIKSLVQLLALSLQDIAKRFDIELVNFIGQLKGELRLKLDFFKPDKRFQQGFDLLYEISHSPLLIKPLGKLLEQLERFLYQQDLLTSGLRFELTLRDKASVSFDLLSAQGEYKADKWLSLLALRLESIKLTAPVTGVSLSVVKFLTNQGLTEDLFNRQMSRLSDAELVTLLEAKLGEGKVFAVELQDEHQPEFASQYKPALGSPKPLKTVPLLRPSYLLEQPVAITQPLTILSAPERIQTSWWREQQICRDYFIARDPNGQLSWVFRHPKGYWFTHGYFG